MPAVPMESAPQVTDGVAHVNCESKKQHTLLMSITSRKIDQFSRFFH